MASRRRPAGLLAGILLLSACAQTRAAAPPEPELVTPEPATVPATAEGATAPSGVTAPDRGARSGRPATATASTTTTTATTATIATAATTSTTSTTVPAGGAEGEEADEAIDLVEPPVTLDLPTDPAAPAYAGWAAFDASLQRELLVGGNVGASVAVAIDGEVLHAAGLGVRAAWTFEAVEPVDRFRLASISKVITAVVTLQLVEEGLLALDEPVGARLAASVGVVPGDPAVDAVTVEQLLSHTAGFGAHRALFFGHGAESCPQAAAIALSGAISPPGQFRYSNMGYCLLGLLIEEVTGQSYEEAVYQRLLVPLGITGMRLPGTFDVGPDEAVHQSAAGRNYMEVLGGAGSWIATASDVVRIVDSLRVGTEGWSPLSDDMLRRMQTPALLQNVLGQAAYGLGLFLYADGSFGHTGTIESTHAMVVNRPDGVTWALLVNGEHPSDSSRLRDVVDRAFATAFPA